MRFKILFLFCFFPRICVGEPVLTVTVMLMTGEDSVSVGQSRDIIHSSKTDFSNIGVRLRVNRIVKMRDNYAKWNNIGSGNNKLWLHRETAIKMGYNRRNRVYVMLPPMIESGAKWVGGFAEDVKCKRNGVSVGNAVWTRTNGGNGKRMSSMVLSHETGHLLGCRHQDQEDPVTMMHPAVLMYQDRDVRFSPWCSYVIKNCLKREL